MQRSIIVVLMLLSIAGCGGVPETAPVRGKITFNGQAVTTGTIGFWPSQGRPATGQIDSSGRYELTTSELGDGAAPGKHRVTIEAFRAIGSQSTPKSLQEETAGSREIRIQWIVPETYARQDSSPLSAEVQSGENVINFDLP